MARYDMDRGFGFITPDEGGPDLFVHVSVVSGEPLVASERVRFRKPAERPGPAGRRRRARLTVRDGPTTPRAGDVAALPRRLDRSDGRGAPARTRKQQACSAVL